VIEVLNSKDIHPAEIHRQLVEMYGEGVINEGCLLFNGGRTDVHKEVLSGRLSVIKKNLKDVNYHVRENMPFSIGQLHEAF
jgi:hypothetical protein